MAYKIAYISGNLAYKLPLLNLDKRVYSNSQQNSTSKHTKKVMLEKNKNKKITAEYQIKYTKFYKVLGNNN